MVGRGREGNRLRRLEAAQLLRWEREARAGPRQSLSSTTWCPNPRVRTFGTDRAERVSQPRCSIHFGAHALSARTFTSSRSAIRSRSEPQKATDITDCACMSVGAKFCDRRVTRSTSRVASTRSSALQLVQLQSARPCQCLGIANVQRGPHAIDRMVLYDDMI